MAMDINQMYYFKKIVESDFNLTEASKKIHISQSALSQFIAQLEEVQNITLFERKHNRLISLTLTGHTIYEYVQTILKHYEEMNEKISEIQSKDIKTLYFGATSSFPQILLPEFFTQFAIKHPNIHIELVENGANNIHERFLNSEFDFALLVEPINIPVGFAETRLVSHGELAAFMSDTHHLAKEDTVTWEEIAEYPIVTLNQDYGTYQKVHAAFEKRNLKPNFVFFSSAWQYLVDSIKKDSNTVTIVPLTTPIFANAEHVIKKRFSEKEEFNVIVATRRQKKDTQEFKLVDKLLKKHLPSC